MAVVNLLALPVLVVVHCARPHRRESEGAAAGYAVAIAFLGNAAYAPVLIFLNERFPTALRASGTGLSWNIGFAIGGTMPIFVSLASPATTDIPVALACFAVAIYALFLIGSLLVPETLGRFSERQKFGSVPMSSPSHLRCNPCSSPSVRMKKI